MSLRDLVRGQRLKIQLALNEAKSGAPSRGGGVLGGGVLGNIISQRGDIIGRASPRNRQVAETGEQPPNFEPKLPILGLFMQGSRPLRETVSNLILSTQQQPQPQNEPSEPPNTDPQIGTCPMCGADVLTTFEYCPVCGHVLKDRDGSAEKESWSLSVQA